MKRNETLITINLLGKELRASAKGQQEGTIKLPQLVTKVLKKIAQQARNTHP